MTFQPGQSGNPGGGNNRKVITSALISRLMWDIDAQPRKGEIKTVAHGIVEKLIKKALDGDMRAITEIYDRVEGKALQTIKDETERAPMDIMEAARRLAFALNSAALLGQPVDDRFAKLVDVTPAEPEQPEQAQIDNNQ